jgi:hypothetical protein
MKDCQVLYKSGVWHNLLAEDGPVRGELRCPECEQKVHYHKQSRNGHPAHFEHNRPVDHKCPRRAI